MRHAEFAGLGVHELDECLDRAAGDARQRMRGIVGRLDHHCIDEFLDRKRFARIEKYLCAAHLGILRGHLDGGGERQRAARQFVVEHGKRHQLGHARRRSDDVGPILEDHVARRGIHDDGALVGGGIVHGRRARGRFPRVRGERRRGKRKCDQQGGTTQKNHPPEQGDFARRCEPNHAARRGFSTSSGGDHAGRRDAGVRRRETHAGDRAYALLVRVETSITSCGAASF